MKRFSTGAMSYGSISAEAHETLHVGDHPECDVDGANNAGLRTAWVNRDGAEWPDHLQRPNVIVRDIGELLKLLGAGA
mgnify:CR=1 FL=1